MNQISHHINRILSTWKVAFSDKMFAAKIILTPGLFILYSAVTQNLGSYVESRKGIQLTDELLYFLPSYDFSVPVFILLYTSLTLVVLSHLDKPNVILRIVEMHFFVAIVRQLCILLIALEPPAGLIVLRDVFLENTVYPRQSPLTKDLFFSGHAASIWLYYLCAERKTIKHIMIGSTVIMSLMILSMRVHYTYDVYGAILITTFLYKIPSWLKSKWAEGALVKVRSRK